MIDDVISMDKCGKDSTMSNAIINSFVDSKRQEFGVKKCHKMHIGGKSSICTELNIKGTPIENTTSEKYLGDVISSNGKNDENLIERKNKAWGIVREAAI